MGEGGGMSRTGLGISSAFLFVYFLVLCPFIVYCCGQGGAITVLG